MEALQGPDVALSGDVQIVCSGTDGAVALEDTYVAGRLCAGLSGRRTDAARLAESVARAYTTPLQALGASAGAAALTTAGLGEDVNYCATESTLDAVPHVEATSAGAAIVVDAAATADQSNARAAEAAVRQP